MPNTTYTPDDLAGATHTHHCSKAVCWSAILAGTFAALSLSLTLLVLGTALGLSSISPWTYANPSATTLTVGVVVWLIVMQWISSGLGGYLAGRLRSKYTALHTDEVFFRDTAHGFLSWAVASVVVALLSASALGAGIHGMHRADRGYASESMGARMDTGPSETIQRADNTSPQAKATEERNKEAAETARKAAARLSIFTFLAMVVGAFIASVAGALGGKRRDEY